MLLIKKEYLKDKLPSRYSLGLHFNLASDTKEITAEWTITGRWKTKSKEERTFEKCCSKTVTKTGAHTWWINPTPEDSSILDISIEMTQWVVTKRSIQKRVLSIDPLDNGPSKLARISSESVASQFPNNSASSPAYSPSSPVHTTSKPFTMRPGPQLN